MQVLFSQHVRNKNERDNGENKQGATTERLPRANAAHWSSYFDVHKNKNENKTTTKINETDETKRIFTFALA